MNGIGQLIGKGGQAQVFEYGEWGKRACKVMPKSINAYREIAISLRLQDRPGVCKVHEVFEDSDKDKVCMVMDRYEKSEWPVRYMEPITDYIRQVVQILEGVHDAGVIHNDIKPQNIMRASGTGKDLVLIDFGCSILSKGEVPPIKLATPVFCSIDALSGKTCTKSDMWSVGVMAYYLLVGEYPFQGRTAPEVFREIFTKDLRLRSSIVWDMDDTGKEGNGNGVGWLEEVEADFLHRLLERDPDARMSATEALAHPFLR